MTNEEKANKILDSNYYVTFGEKNAAYNAALEMAKWKDEQFKDFVSKEAVLNILKEEHDIALMEQISTVSNTKLLLTSRLIDKINML